MPRAVGALDDVRRRNLGSILRLVHRSGPVSRSWLTRRTGLNRSTVGDLVGELVALGLLVEGDPETTNRVGRPSPVVAPHPDVVAVAVNPEVDAVTVAVVGLGARVDARERHELDAPPSPEETARVAADTVRALAGRRVAGIGLAVPGLVREADGVVRWGPHLGWRDAPLRELVEHEAGVPATVANDASLGALAEHRFGAGRGVDDLVYLNGGASGIGGGVIAGGRPLGGRGGYAGEFGQNRPGFAEPGDRVTEHGALEDEVSRERVLAALGRRSATEAELAELLLATDRPDLRAELGRQRRVLAAALATAVNVLNPEAIVLGGYLATLLRSDPADVRALLDRLAVAVAAEGVRLRAAALGDDRLLVGAAELAFGALLDDPARITGEETGAVGQ
jgi:predicted NBD/HSP70 family sugar kinase